MIIAWPLQETTLETYIIAGANGSAPNNTITASNALKGFGDDKGADLFSQHRHIHYKKAIGPMHWNAIKIVFGIFEP